MIDESGLHSDKWEVHMSHCSVINHSLSHRAMRMRRIFMKVTKMKYGLSNLKMMMMMMMMVMMMMSVDATFIEIIRIRCVAAYLCGSNALQPC